MSFVQAVTQELSKLQGLDNSTDIGSNMVECLKVAMQTTLKKKSKNKSANELWKDDKDLNRLLSQRRGLKRNTNEYKNITRSIKNRVNALRNDKITKEAREINEFSNRRKVEELYRSFKSDNSSFKYVKSSKRCDPHKLKEFFKQHFTAKMIEEDPIELEEVPEFIKKLQNISTEGMVTGPPGMDELVKVIRRLKNVKSASDIPTIFIKHALDSREFAMEVVKLYKTIWVAKSMPKDWGHSRLVTLWKGPSKGKANDPSTYRGLQIGSSLCKIMIIIIINRLKEWYERQLLDQQQGFRSARGTTDGIFVAKCIHQVTDKMKKPTFILFVDLKAAFDHVERSWLFKSIKTRFPTGSDKTLVQLIEALYSYTSTALAEAPEDKFELNTGVRQGGPESPMLYNLYMDFVMRIYLDACKIKEVKFLQLKYEIPSSAGQQPQWGEFTLDWCDYADDLQLAFEDEESLQTGIVILDEIFRKYRLNINTSKPKTMILNQQYEEREYPTSIATLRGKQLENVTTYRYLGCEIKYDEPTTGETELNLRCDAATCKFYSLGRNMLNPKIHLKTRALMLNSLVRSRIVYSCQTWSVTKSQINRMNSLYMTLIRKMTKGGYARKTDSMSYRMTNEDLLRVSGTEDLRCFIQRQQRNYVGHVIRKENTSIVKRLLFNKNTSCKPGRTKTTLLSSVMSTEESTPDKLFNDAMNRMF